jgi:uncharacterized protein (TIGR02611 family)
VTSVLTKVVVTLVGVAVIVVGVVLSGPGIPGPGFVVIIFGLAILATEYAWAERLLQRAKAALKRASDRARAMDPAVRRRRLLLSGLTFLVVGGALVAYLVVYDWPGWAVDAWDWVQGFSGLVPELPGM